MAFPVILVDSNTGSDSGTSGAGPGTAITGTAASVAGTATSVSITDAVALGPVLTDGSACLYYNDTTANHRRFDRITAISGSSGAWTVTVDNGYSTTTGPFTWAIGGKRASIGNATSNLLVDNTGGSPGDAMAGWTIQMASSHSETIAATYRFGGRNGDTVKGPITLQGDPAASTLPLVKFSNNGAAILCGSNFIVCQYFELQNTNVTKTASKAVSAINGMVGCRFVGLKINDATNTWWKGFEDSQNAGDNWTIESCSIGNCANNGIDFTTQSSIRLRNCEIFKCGGIGINVTASSVHVNGTEIRGNTVSFCTGDGMFIFSANVLSPSALPTTIDGNVFHGNGGAGLNINSTNANTEVYALAIIQNNRFTFNATYGINFSGTGMTDAVLTAAQTVIRNNNFNGNTSGKYNGMTIASSINEVTTDPSGGLASATKDYAGVTNGRNFMSAVSKGTAWPKGGTQHVGDTGLTAGNYGGATYSYVDEGLQHQDVGGGNTFLASPTIVLNRGTF